MSVCLRMCAVMDGGQVMCVAVLVCVNGNWCHRRMWQRSDKSVARLEAQQSLCGDRCRRRQHQLLFTPEQSRERAYNQITCDYQPIICKLSAVCRT
mmetsp:Transcript_21313/g.60798  ORF Transcript_21313/g.60798 Transcript_21313/m.60798 type:complete len:96 (-) Transcript_21313:709-996(-)